MLRFERRPVERDVGGAVDGVKALLAKGHAYQFTFQIVGPAVIGTGKKPAILGLAMVAFIQGCAAV